MSLSVAKQPRTDIKQLITSGTVGTGDMFSGIFEWIPFYHNHVVNAGNNKSDVQVPFRQTIFELCCFKWSNNASCRHFSQRCSSVISTSKQKQPWSHYGKPFFITSCLAVYSTSVNSFTIKFQALSCTCVSGKALQNKMWNVLFDICKKSYKTINTFCE